MKHVLAALDRAFGSHGASALDPAVPAAVWRRALAGPAAEFLSRPGKQLRAELVRAGWTLAGGDPRSVPEGLELVVELLHCGSLVIDDVQDASVERRGRPALHELVGVPLAINTGSWMYFWALAEIAELGLAPAAELAVYRLATSTLVRCHQGQALDLATCVYDLPVGDVTGVVATTTNLKTGALCGLATSLGALAASSDAGSLHAAGALGTATGMALQMLDDLGSIAAPARRAKGREDLRDGRPTWPWAWLSEVAAGTWGRLVDHGRTGRDLDGLADFLAEQTVTIGRARIGKVIADAVEHMPAGPARDPIETALRRMEKSYG